MSFLLGQTLDELVSLCRNLQLPDYVAKQLVHWLYEKQVCSFDQMHNISKKTQQAIASHYEIGRSQPITKYVSKDGTVKYLFAVHQSTSDVHPSYVETVVIPESKRKTICVSSQVGCRMGCKFCMTATLGFQGNLPVADILNQIFSVMADNRDEMHESTRWNIVFMGEGEPLDNVTNVKKAIDILTSPLTCAWSPYRITVSSVGISDQLSNWLEQTKCNLALSLHTTFDKERQSIIPAQKKYPLKDIIPILQKFDFSHQRKLSYEYIVWKNFNGTDRHIKRLIELCRQTHAQVNLIMFHRAAENQNRLELEPAPLQELTKIQSSLNENGVIATIRQSRGEDIWAACGMLVQHRGQK